MPTFYTDNPITDAENYYAWLEDHPRTLPKCNWCGATIEDEYCYEVDGGPCCQNCLDTYFKIRTIDIAE